MTFDPRAALRRVKPERVIAQLQPRASRDSLNFAGQESRILVLDTNVYIATVSGALPKHVRAFVERARLFHCSVCLAELMIGIGNANPVDSRWKPMRDHYIAMLETIPSERVLTPDIQTWAEAGLIAGTLARTQNYQKQQRLACLNDALILLTAAKAGLPVLTENRKDFDLIQQLASHARFIHF